MKVKVSFAKPTTMMKTETYEQMVAEVERLTKENKDLQDALVIAEKNKTLRDLGWDMLHQQIEGLQRENRGLSMDLKYYQHLAEEVSDQLAAKATELAEAKALITELNDQIGASESALDDTHADLVFQKGLQQDCETYIAELKGKLAEKSRLYDQAFKAAADLAEMLKDANEDKEAAIDEVGELNVELMDRDARIDELERQVEFWKKAADENAGGWKRAEVELDKAQSKCEALRKSVDEACERANACYSQAQYEEERANELEATNKKFYAQIIGQRDTIDHLQRQLKANEEEYLRIHGKYDELFAAAETVAHITRK